MTGIALVACCLLASCATPEASLAPAPPAPTLPAEMPTGADGIVLPSPPAGEVVEDEVVEEVAPTVAASDAASDEDAVGEIAGYSGDDWAELLDGEVAVLDDSVTVRDGLVLGLVRNGREVPVGPVTVSAAGAAAALGLPVLRPGEPAPFVLEVDGVADGAEVAVTVDAPESDDRPARALRLSTFWQRGVTDPRPVDTYLFTDPSSGPLPAVAMGSVQAAEEVEGLVVVAAWINDAGRVLAVDPDGELQFESLDAGAAGDFLVASTGPSSLDDARLVLWGSGS